MSAVIGLVLDGLSALAVFTAAALLIVHGRGSQALAFVRLAHTCSFYFALLVFLLAASAVLCGRWRLGILAGSAGIALWLVASVLIPLADASER